jgi:hypothetical protein
MSQIGAPLINTDVTKVIVAKSGYSNMSNKAIDQGCDYKEGKVREQSFIAVQTGLLRRAWIIRS